MIVFRLAKEKYIDDLSGKGAELSGGRWNSKGNAVIYTSGSRALCTAEIAVHLPLNLIPLDYCLAEIEIPDNAIEEIKVQDLPQNWKAFPYPRITQKLGDSFIKNKKSLVLMAPSVVVQGDNNFLINPAHPAISKVKIINTTGFSFDERLFKR